MTKSLSTPIIAVLLAGALTLVGCSKDKEEEQAASSGILSSNATILQYVPADSPYVIASLQPMPDDLLDKIEPKIDEVLKAYEQVMRQAVAMAQSEMKEDSAEAAETEKTSAIVNELSSLMSLEGLRSAGIERDSQAVFYGNGLLPVLRITLSDGALFEAALSRIEKEAGEKMAVATIDGNSFRYVDTGEVKVLVAVLEKQVAVSLVPSVFDDSQIGQVLGFTQPDSSIADAGVLQKISSDYGYKDYMVGYVDFQQLVETFVGDASGLDADLIELMGDERPQLTNVCRNEIIAMAGVAPRMVMGYTKVTADSIESQVVLEMRDDIAKGMATLPAAVPGLVGDKGGLMSMGMSIDVMAARTFYEARLDALEESPFECEDFAEFQAGVSAGRQALNQPVPPMVYDFKGFLAVINDMDGLDLASSRPPESIDGQFLLAMDNAPALLAMGAMFSPELAGLNVEPNGEPVPFSSPQLNAVVDNVHVALTDGAVALSFGEGMESGLEGMLSAKAKDDGTVMSFSMDAGRYYAFLGEAMLLAEQDDQDEMPAEMRKAMNDIMVASSDFYDRLSASVRLTGRGVEIDSSMTIKD